MKRLFLGIELSEAACEDVTGVQSRLREVATRQGVRFVRPEKIHLTLVFIGAFPEEEIEALEAACLPVCQRYRALDLSARGIGGFPGLHRPKVLWTGVGGDVDELTSMQSDLANSLASHIEVEKKAYTPHLTLARISPGSKEVGRLAAEVANEVGDVEIARWTVEEVTLFESTPDGRYEALRRWPLAR